MSVQRAAIDDNYFESLYDEALGEFVRRSRAPEKDRPIGYLAWEGDHALEKDGVIKEIFTKIVTTFDRLLAVLEE